MSEINNPEAKEKLSMFDETGRLSAHGKQVTKFHFHEMIALLHGSEDIKNLTVTELQMLESCMKAQMAELFNYKITGIKPWERKDDK